MPPENSAVLFSSVFLAKIPPNDALIPPLAEWGRNLRAAAVVKGTEGNLSFRTRLGFIITGTDVALDAISGETVSEITGVVYGLNKTSVYVKGLVVPSRESILHSQIYEELPDVNAIFHVHDGLVKAKAARLGTPVTENEQPAGSIELAKEAVNLLKYNKGARYFVLRNHGVIALGQTLNEAGKRIEEMHAKAK